MTYNKSNFKEYNFITLLCFHNRFKIFKYTVVEPMFNKSLADV